MTFNPLLPLATDGFANSQTYITTNWNALNTVYAVNHVTFNDATVADRGKHISIVQKEIAFGGATPVVTGDEGSYFSQEILVAGGKVEGFYKDSAGYLSHVSAIKAWCSFNGTSATPVTPSSGFNVTNVTWVAGPGVGARTFTVNFTTPLADTNYCVQITGNTLNPSGITKNLGNFSFVGGIINSVVGILILGN